MRSIVIGLGEVGSALLSVLKREYGDRVTGYDLKDGALDSSLYCEVVNICIPWGPGFIKATHDYINQLRPELVIIHSTVPAGTTDQFPDAVHSPVLGDHTNMVESITRFTKWVGGYKARVAADYMQKAGITCRTVRMARETELLKLMCLAKYGMSIAFAQYQKEICDQNMIDYEDVLAWDNDYNKEVAPHLKRPILTPPNGPIGGHCVIPGTKLLNQQYPTLILQEVLRYEKKQGVFTAWHPSNIYPTAKIGKDVSVGMFSEIGNNAVIGDGVRIGAGCFIPEGVTIEDGAWIGPHVIFSNDKFPPSGKDNWLPTLVKKGARIGAGACILPGIVIGEGALIGMGATVTHDVVAGETWAGNPARKL